MIWKESDLIEVDKYNIIEEGNKYYIIELDKGYFLECLTCKAPNDFSKNDILYFKEEKDVEWRNCSQENFEQNEDILEINLYEKYNIQFLKINKIISDIQIFIRKYRGLIVSDRRDGFGCRIASMINAMYLSKKTGFKFGYSWIRVNFSSNDSKVIWAMTDEDEIFDKKFINENSYTAKKLMSRGTYFIENSLENIKNKPYENSWGYFCTTYRSLGYFKDIDKDEYRRECKFLWKHLPFNQRYLKLINDAKKHIAKLGADWVAIHVRNGDNVYSESLRHLLLLDVSINRIIPYQLVLKIIDDLTSEGKKIVLFSPDIELTFSLQSFYREKNEYIYIADDFILEEMSEMERTIYDFVLMSKASEIYMPKDSLYSDFAYRIGEAKKAISIDKMYSSNELYDIIQTYNKYSINVHRLQKAASCAYQYRLACDLRKTNKEKIDILNEGLSLDPDNYSFLIEKINIMLYLHNFKEVDDILKELFVGNNKPFFDTLFRKTPTLKYYYGGVIQRFKNNDISAFLYCNYVSARIHENLGDWNKSLKMVIDVIFVKNNSYNLYLDYLVELLKKYKKMHVTYDEIIFFKSIILQLQNKSLENIALFERVKHQLDSKAKELISSKNQELTQVKNQLDSIKQQLDFKTKELNFALQHGTAKSRIQNQLSYKLGQAMIVNSKNIFGILFMLLYIISTLLSHRQEKKIYQEKIKKDPSLKLPPLESYPDYKEALKEKECFTYKLGEALIRANNNWYGGGYIKLWFEVRKLKKDFKKEK